MKNIAVVAVVLPIALLVGACNQDGRQRVAGPEVAVEEDAVAHAAWVTDRTAVAQAALAAARDPNVQRAVAQVGSDRLEAHPEGTVRLVGRTTGGQEISLTSIPYRYKSDATRVVYFTKAYVAGATLYQTSDVIGERAPRPDEWGFELVQAGVNPFWVKESVATETVPAAEPAAVAPERDPLRSPQVSWKLKALVCLLAVGYAGCDAGIGVSDLINPVGTWEVRAGSCMAGAALATAACVYKGPNIRIGK
jgi:hypothetical protein